MLYNGNYNTNGPAFAYAVFSTLTYGQGTGFCHALVTSANGGSFQVPLGIMWLPVARAQPYMWDVAFSSCTVHCSPAL